MSAVLEKHPSKRYYFVFFRNLVDIRLTLRKAGIYQDFDSQFIAWIVQILPEQLKDLVGIICLVGYTLRGAVETKFVRDNWRIALNRRLQ